MTKRKVTIRKELKPYRAYMCALRLIFESWLDLHWHHAQCIIYSFVPHFMLSFCLFSDKTLLPLKPVLTKVLVDCLGEINPGDHILIGSEHYLVKFVSVKYNTITVYTVDTCLLYTSPSPRDATLSRMPSSA